MWRGVLGSMVCVLAVAGAAAGQGRDVTVGGITIVTGKFQSYKDGVLKVHDLRSREEREFRLGADTTVVSMRNTRQKLPQATAFNGVNVGRIIRVYLRGKGDGARVEAVQIGVGAGDTVGRTGPVREDLSNVKARFVVTAEELYKEYKADKEAAITKYQNQVVEVSGVVSDVGRNYADASYINLGAAKEFTGVMCYTVAQEPWARIAPGQKVTLKGRWPPRGAFLFYATLMSTSVVKAGPNPAIKVSAPELAGEFLADKAATKRKYDDRWLLVAGEVAGRHPDRSGNPVVDLQGKGGLRLPCSFGKQLEPFLKGVRPGRHLRVLCRPFVSDVGRGELTLNACLPITEKE